MRVLFVILLYICYTCRTDSAATCETSTHTFTDTDISSSTTIQCVDPTDLTTYPNNKNQWYQGATMYSMTNDLSIEGLVTPGVNQFMCDFTLNATDTNSEVTTCSFTVTVNSLPNLSTSTIPPFITYPSSVTITCSANGGYDTPTLTWEDSTGGVLSNNPTLSFNNNEQLVGDNKEFVCVSVNSAGEFTTSIFVTVKPNPPTVSLTPQSPSVYVGDSTTLTCSATSDTTSTAFDYSWFKDNILIINGIDGVVITDDVLTISDTRTLNQGTYRCDVTVYNSDTGSDNTQLTVTSLSPLVTITSQPTKSTYIENDSLTLTCQVTPRPLDNTDSISITWSSNSGMISNGETLTFQPLSVSDEGTIMCSATVGNSEVNSSTFLLDIIPPAPNVTLAATTQTPVLGDDITLTCVVTNNSPTTLPVSITWLKDMIEISGQTNPTLVITNVDLSDTAGYTCIASIRDSENTTSNVLEIMIQQIPNIISISPLDTNPVIEGVTSGSLTCSATGIPIPNITWTDNNGDTRANPLELIQLTNQMNGTFTCIATSLAGFDSEQIVIIIVPPTPSLSVVSSESNPVLGTSFTLSCYVTNTLPDGLTLSDYSFEWTTGSPPVPVSTEQSYTFTVAENTGGMEYMCSASVAGSGIGNANSGVLVLKGVPHSIEFEIIPDTVYIGQSRTVTCMGEGVPTPTAEIRDQADKIISSISGVVDLNRFSQSDDGKTETYNCTLKNIHGTMSRLQTFTISQPRIDIVFLSDPPTVTKGNAVTLSCSVTTDPDISLIGTTYSFHTNENKLGDGQVSADGSSATYTIAEFTDNEASLICKVSIQNGRLEVEETLTVPILDLLAIVAVGVSFVVIILLFALVCLILIMILCCLRQRKRDEPEHYPDYIGLENTSGSQQAAFSYPIPVDNYSNTYEQLLAESQQELKEQYQQLFSIKGNTEVARKAVNNTKNRYPDVLAYDHSRVIISKCQGTDYINANYMEGFGTDGNAYIAAQSPLGAPKADTPTPTTGAATPQLNTVNDFWRMIWELNITTIVMLTNLIEGNRIKCALYWPEDLQNYGRIRVRKIEEKRFCDYVIRKFSIQRIQVRSNDGLTRQVTQFHFVAWPDHGVPLFPIAMIQFVKLVRAFINQTEDGTNVPTLVHCSAGVGRTGTFICLDVILQQLAAGEKLIDIWKETSRLRKRRNYMIQEYLQYEFVHQALNEYIQFGDTECSAADFPKMVAYLHEVTEENPYKVGMSRLEIEFKKLQPRIIQTQHKNAKLSENAFRDRFINTMPFNSNRVKLNPFPGIVGSDYINASFIDSDKTHWAFIATQGPLKTTMEDFCRMLIEQNSNVIIMLSENSEDKTEDYFSFSQTHYGPYHFQVTRKHIVNDYIHREMTVHQDNSSQIHPIHHFQLTKPLAPNFSQKDCAKALLSLITGLTVTLQPEEERKGPMVVHCGTGNGMTGVFLAVYVIIQRLAYEDKVDVFNTVKRLRMQRVAMVQSPDQYDLCYRAVMEYLQSSS